MAFFTGKTTHPLGACHSADFPLTEYCRIALNPAF